METPIDGKDFLRNVYLNAPTKREAFELARLSSPEFLRNSSLHNLLNQSNRCFIIPISFKVKEISNWIVKMWKNKMDEKLEFNKVLSASLGLLQR